MRSILIAEYDSDLVNCLKMFFKDNYEVICCTERKEIITNVKSVDLLLIESRLTLMYGTDFIKEINALSPHAEIVIMGDPPFNEDSEKLILERIGARIIRKPFEPEQLTDIINKNCPEV